MSTIFASDFALKGIAPNTGRWAGLDLKPRATARPIGDELHNADTMTFQRIRDLQDGADRCDIPWCVDDFKPDVDTNPEDALVFGAVHMHYGVTKRVELHSYERSHEDVEAHDHPSTAEVRIMRFDDDHAVTPTVGEAQVYVEGIGAEPIHPADLLRLTRVIEGQAHVALEATGREQVGRHAVAIPEHTGTCYLPWCTGCEKQDPHGVANGDYAHAHVGTAIDVEVLGMGTHDTYKVKVELERTDWDSDDTSQYSLPTTGETFIYMAVAENGQYEEGVRLTFDAARTLVDNLTSLTRTGSAHDGLRNPNRFTAEQMQEFAAIDDAMQAARLVRDETKAYEMDAEKDRVRAEDDERRRPMRAAHALGERAGESWLGRRSVRLAFAVYGLRVTDPGDRMSFAQGMFRAGCRDGR